MTTTIIQFIFLFLATTVFGQTGTVVFQISNIQSEKGGEISAGIFTEENFPKVGKQLKSMEQRVVSESMVIEIKNVPIGIYGAVAFQDIDLNKDLNTNFVGFPKEPIGFANDAKIRLGPPSFEAASIHVKAGEITTVPIKLN